jgi:hypothetical protein
MSSDALREVTWLRSEMVGDFMYNVRLTPDEMKLLIEVVREYRGDDVDELYPDMFLLTNKADFIAAADLLLAVAEERIPSSFAARIHGSDIEITRESDGQFLLRGGDAIGIVAKTAVPYHRYMVTDDYARHLLESIEGKFMNGAPMD